MASPQPSGNFPNLHTTGNPPRNGIAFSGCYFAMLSHTTSILCYAYWSDSKLNLEALMSRFGKLWTEEHVRWRTDARSFILFGIIKWALMEQTCCSSCG